jgi:peptidoglycan/LPS O-acetylase OafA/YrhL
LSGFVLGLVAEPRMLAGTGWRTFIVARWRRLWPMIAAGAVVGAAAFLIDHDAQTTLLFLVLALAMIPLLSPSYEPYPLNGPQWSLLMELMINLAHGLLLARLSLRRLALLTVVLGAALLAVIVRDSSNFWLLAELRVGFSYFLGLIIARCYRQGRLPTSAPIDWKLPILLIAGAVLALPYVPLAKVIGDSMLIFAVHPLAFLAAILARPPAAADAALVALGRLSYPLYAVHFPIVVLVHHLGSTGWYATSAAGVALALATALAALLERPRASRQSAAGADKPAIA